MYRWIDHTAELELEITAPTERDVLAEAVRALGELVGDCDRGPVERRRLEVHAPDRGALLADWITELVYHSETEDFVPCEARELTLSGDGLRASVEGRRGEPSHLVKAATYHGLVFEEGESGWRARVVLDV
jgi:SHS2 domain-containing protein